MMRLRFLALAAAAVVSWPLPDVVFAQQPANAAPSIDERVRREVVDTIAAQLERLYVDADTARLIAERLRSRLRAGAYARLTDPQLFAEALTDDLRAVNEDLHLSVGYSPDQPGMRPGPQGLPTPYSGPPKPASAPPKAVEQMRRSNFNVARAEVLPGNVGLIEIRGFAPLLEETKEALVAALEFVGETDAVIIDARRLPGGSGGTSNFLISHFTGPDTVASLTVHNRSAGQSVTRYTLAEVPGPRRTDVPLYILIGRGTASAGEDFAFVLKNLGRATLVGDRTAGAGHNNAFVYSGHGFNTSMSYTRVVDPRTGAEWERVGVQPDIRTAEREALTTAHAHALERLAQATDDAQWKRVLTNTRETVLAKQQPRRIGRETLAAYAGTYDGGRIVSLEGDRLTYRRFPHRPPDELVPLSDSLFAVAELPAVRIAFERGDNGRVLLRFLGTDGEGPAFARTGPPPA